MNKIILMLSLMIVSMTNMPKANSSNLFLHFIENTEESIKFVSQLEFKNIRTGDLLYWNNNSSLDCQIYGRVDSIPIGAVSKFSIVPNEGSGYFSLTHAGKYEFWCAEVPEVKMEIKVIPRG